jgi:integrase
MDIQTAIELFRADYLRRPKKKAQTYKTEYGQIFNKLNPRAELTTEVLIECIETLPEDSRQRKRAYTAVKALAEFNGLDCSPFLYVGATYSPTKIETRILPSDQAIVNFYHCIENDKWRWVYGAIATYGLRPHEAFYLKINSDGTANVLEGKTGPRKVWPYLPEWFYQFSLTAKRLPNVEIAGKSHEQLGRSCCKYLRSQARCPFKIYDLRHAWSVRVLDLGLSDHLAAQQMGHTVEIHQKIYQRWISEREQHAAFQEILKKRHRR